MDTLNESPTPETVLEYLFKIMQGNLHNLGHNGLLTRVFVDNAELAHAIAPGLPELDIRYDYRATLS